MTDPVFTRLKMTLLFSLLLAQTLFATWPGIDLAVSRALTDGTGHFIATSGLAPTFSAGLRTAMELLSFLTILAALSLWVRGRLTAAWQRVAAFVVLNLVLAPGVLVNLVLKSHVGRARPDSVTAFGGTLEFTPAWQVGSECLKNCSFTSGEVALSSTWAICLTVLLWPHLAVRGKTYATTAAVGMVLLIAYLRLALGRHFLSDAVFSVLFSAAVALVLYRLLNIGTARLACPPQDLLAAARTGLVHLSAHARTAWQALRVLSGVTVVPPPETPERKP